ncbi:hypothetical protein DI494_01205 [Stenotrophomonas maltophilia]|nr:hypothetical protein DI494_01205 [Stenotrophomonas maltophilia]
MQFKPKFFVIEVVQIVLNDLPLQLSFAALSFCAPIPQVFVELKADPRIGSHTVQLFVFRL